MVVKVRAESQDHSTAVNAFERVLQRLKAMEELQVTAIRSRFCAGGMWMNVGVEGQVRYAPSFMPIITHCRCNVYYVGCEIFFLLKLDIKRTFALGHTHVSGL